MLLLRHACLAEPNGGFWLNSTGAHAPNATQYSELLTTVGQALATRAPGTVLTGPTTAGMDFPYIQQVLERGGLAYLSGVSVHPYRPSPPESACYDYATLRSMIANYSAASGDGWSAGHSGAAFPNGDPRVGASTRVSPPTPAGVPPVLSSEWGYETCTKPASCSPSDPKSISESLQAAYLQRRFVVDALCGVPMSIDYDWRNGGDDPSQREQNFGGVLHDPTGNSSQPFVPKPKFLAASTYKSLVGSLQLRGRVAADVTTAAGSTRASAPGSHEPSNATFVAEFAGPSSGQAQGQAQASSSSDASSSLVYAAWTMGSQGYCGTLPSHHDCGFYKITEKECVEGRGCCYTPNHNGLPWCQWPMGGGSVRASFDVDEQVPQGACFEQRSWNGTAEGKVCAGGSSGRQLSVELTHMPVFLSMD